MVETGFQLEGRHDPRLTGVNGEFVHLCIGVSLTSWSRSRFLATEVKLKHPMQGQLFTQDGWVRVSVGNSGAVFCQYVDFHDDVVYTERSYLSSS